MHTETQQAVVHDTFIIERTYPVTPEKAFAAFSNPEKKRRWYAADNPNHDVQEFTLDFQAGGKEVAVYKFKEGSPFPGVPLRSDAWYQDIVPNKRIIIAQTMSIAGNHMSSALITFEFLAAEKGTQVVLTHQAAFYEHSDGPAMRKQGWTTLMDLLEKALVA
jgi:uncharacterized protein YndB with AHSA1/START domain